MVFYMMKKFMLIMKGFYCDNNIMRWDFGYEDYPRNDQQYMSKGSYNPQDCNEPPYNTN